MPPHPRSLSSRPCRAEESQEQPHNRQGVSPFCVYSCCRDQRLRGPARHGGGRRRDCPGPSRRRGSLRFAGRSVCRRGTSACALRLPGTTRSVLPSLRTDASLVRRTFAVSGRGKRMRASGPFDGGVRPAVANRCVLHGLARARAAALSRGGSPMIVRTLPAVSAQILSAPSIRNVPTRAMARRRLIRMGLLPYLLPRAECQGAFGPRRTSCALRMVATPRSTPIPPQADPRRRRSAQAPDPLSMPDRHGREVGPWCRVVRQMPPGEIVQGARILAGFPRGRSVGTPRGCGTATGQRGMSRRRNRGNGGSSLPSVQ